MKKIKNQNTMRKIIISLKIEEKNRFKENECKMLIYKYPISSRCNMKIK